MKNINKETMVFASGAGIGLIQTIVTKEYVDKNFGNFPFIGDMLPAPWGRWSTLGNIIIGGIFFGLTSFSKIISNKSQTANDFLQMYGITTLIGGVMNGIMPGTTTAGMRLTSTPQRTLRVARTASNMANLTPTGIPQAKILS